MLLTKVGVTVVEKKNLIRTISKNKKQEINNLKK